MTSRLQALAATALLAAAIAAPTFGDTPSPSPLPPDAPSSSAGGPDMPSPSTEAPAAAPPSGATQTPGDYGSRADVRSFARDFAARNGLDALAVMATLSAAEYQPDIVRLMEPLPAGERSWRAYRSRFVNERRIRNGVRFWQRHRDVLARAARRFGVPEEIIVAITGVETEYGRNMGGFRVLDALATLAFDYPRRAEFFRSELESFLLLAHDGGLEPTAVRGSYAGAMGIAQFMPGSVRMWGVDFDGDGRVDLLDGTDDAIGSVAHFLQQHGWRPSQVPAVPARVTGDTYLALLELGVQPFVLAKELKQYGVKPVVPIAAGMPVALIELESPHSPSQFYLGTQNFYALTRYNQSSFYAMSVIQLAEAVARRRAEQGPAPKARDATP